MSKMVIDLLSSPVSPPISPEKIEANERTALLGSDDRQRSLPQRVNFSPFIQSPAPKFANRSNSKTRWLILFLTCIQAFGMYYCYDMPAALITNLKRDRHLSDIEYNLLYSIYSLPNIILPLFGGVLIDYIGVYKSMIIFCTLVLFGQVVVSLSVQYGTFYGMVFGRFLFGLGGESANVASSALTTQWFKNKELGLALGLSLSISRLGSVLNYSASPWLATNYSLEVSMYAGVVIMCLSLTCIFLITAIDTRWVRRKKAKGLEVERVQTDGSVNMVQMLDFHYIFWLLNGSCVLCYGCILPFMNIASDFFQTKYGVNQTTANTWLSIPFTISAFGSPPLGILSDKAGLRQWLILSSSVALTFVHFMMGLTTIHPMPFLIIMGCAYSVYASAMWPSAALIVDDTVQLGTAYGVITAVQNLGLTAVPIIVGFIKEYDGYFWVQIFFGLVGASGAMFGTLILHQDKKTGDRLASPTLKAQQTNSALFRAQRASRTISPLVGPDNRSPLSNSSQNASPFKQLQI